MERASTAELRRFGLTVGAAFLVLASISWWRGHVIPPRVLGALGVFLLVPGLLAPSVLGPVQRGWMRGATVLGEINGRIILTVLFFVVIWPIGRILRFVRDPLDRSMSDGKTSNWVKREKTAVDPERYERQF
jgi:Saxitoxin biosynthesis operon protein SxtJ